MSEHYRYPESKQTRRMPLLRKLGSAVTGERGLGNRSKLALQATELTLARSAVKIIQASPENSPHPLRKSERKPTSLEEFEDYMNAVEAFHLQEMAVAINKISRRPRLDGGAFKPQFREAITRELEQHDLVTRAREAAQTPNAMTLVDLANAADSIGASRHEIFEEVLFSQESTVDTEED